MRNLAQLAMLALAILLMWGGPKLQSLLGEGQEGAAAASNPAAPVAAPGSESTASRKSMDDLLAPRSSYEPDPSCSRVRTCGNGVLDAGEDCDGADLGGASCKSLGFTGACGDDPGCVQPSLTCSAACKFDFRGCTAARADEPARFVDNGDGTVTDRLTHLMWEKKCHGAGCSFDHNVRTKLDWKAAASWWLDKLNDERGRGYAGYSNWRLPTIRELQTILVEPWPCRSNPCIDEKMFGPGLTGEGPYWTAISLANDPAQGWFIGFNNGRAGTDLKRSSVYIRAVRTMGSDGSASGESDLLGGWSAGGYDPGCSWVRLCGNGLLDAVESCDGHELGGRTCASMGFSGDCATDRNCVAQSLSCSPVCTFDFSGCTSLTGADPPRFAEHGDGTITDRLTGLMWERKCRGEACPPAHEVDHTVSWRGAASDWVDELNSEHGGGYAGHSDWRLPTIAELRSLTLNPWPCDGPCFELPLLGLDSTVERSYWSATTFDPDKSRAWSLTFHDGRADPSTKQTTLHVLAVRRGTGHAPGLLASR